MGAWVISAQCIWIEEETGAWVISAQCIWREERTGRPWRVRRGVDWFAR